MARWKLMQPHYLNIEDDGEDRNKWEYKETDRATGRTKRKTYIVPVLLNPNDPNDFNYPNTQMIIVTDKADPSFPADIIFVGNPTPDMEPVDTAAMEISEKLQSTWVHPIESLPGQGYGDARMMEFAKELAAVMSSAQPSSPIAVKGANDDEITALKKQLEALTATVAALTAPKAAAAAPNPKRV